MLTKLETRLLKYCCKEDTSNLFNTHTFKREFFIKFPKNEFSQVCDSLSSKGYIKIASKDMAGGVQFFLTYDGIHYKEIKWINIKSFLIESVIIPIAVSVITSLIVFLITA